VGRPPERQPAQLVGDGLHARTDGFTSLAVLLGAGGAALGWWWADLVVGLLITVAIVEGLRNGRRVVYQIRGGHVRRLLEEALFQADHQVTGEPVHG
jgi:divalent metal cation (Fe/Co/Zn/Cd) transporter